MNFEWKDGLVCWCEDCEVRFHYEDTDKHDTHNIGKLFEIKNGKKVRN